MLRFLRLMILLILIVGVVMGGYLWISRVPTLERYLSHRLHAKVTIEEVKIGLHQLVLLGVTVKDVPPSSFLSAFFAREISIAMNFSDLLKKTIHVEQIQIHDSTLSLELYNYTGSDNNWARLLIHNELHTCGERTLNLDKLILTNVQFIAKRATGKEISLAPIPYLELPNLNNSTLSQIGQTLFRTLLETQTGKPTLGALLDNIATVPENPQASHDPLREITEKTSNFFQNLTQHFRENPLNFNRSPHKMLPIPD